MFVDVVDGVVSARNYGTLVEHTPGSKRTSTGKNEVDAGAGSMLLTVGPVLYIAIKTKKRN